MEKKEPRWYLLWFFASATWLISFCFNLYYRSTAGWLLVLQFLNTVICFVDGVVHARRYKKRHSGEE